MAMLRDLLDGDWRERLAEPGWPTGLQDLDSLTGGIRRPGLWLLLATPGAGRTVLACQFARNAAVAGEASVALISGHERSEAVLSNLVCGQSRLPAHHLHEGSLTDADLGRLAGARQELGDVRLRVLTIHDDAWHFAESTSTPDVNHLIGGPAPADLVVVDDVDLLLDGPLVGALPHLRDWCHRSGFALVLTAPEEGLVGPEGRVLASVRRDADVLLRLSREDQFERESPRAGEASLEVLAHRGGPTAVMLLAFQGHYRRFICCP